MYKSLVTLFLIAPITLALSAQTNHPQEVPLSINISTILNRNQTFNFRQRLNAAHQLGKRLSEDEITYLYTFLHRKIDNDNLRPLQFNTVKNDVLSNIMSQKTLPGAMTSNLIVMFKDKGFDPIWRDYCVQYMGQWYPRIENEEERKQIKAALTEALKETQSTIAGTALICMKRNLFSGGFDKKTVATQAYTLAADQAVSVGTRTTALQIAASLGHKDTLALARETVKKTTHVQLKLSCIAVLGMKGQKSDLKYLKEKSKSSDVRLRIAATAALKKLTTTKKKK